MDREWERMKRLFANGRGLRIIPAIMVVFTGLVVAGLTSWSRSQNDALAENAYAQLPLGALTRIEMIRYITEQGGEAITTNHADNFYRMRMGDDYLVLVCGSKGTIDAIAVYSETEICLIPTELIRSHLIASTFRRHMPSCVKDMALRMASAVQDCITHVI